MSQSILSKPQSSEFEASAADASAEQRDGLLEAAGMGDAEAVGLLCDRHGGALFGLARVLVGDPVQAETVVVDVLVRACVDPAAIAPGSRSLRRELARMTYLSAIGFLNDTTRPAAGSAFAKMAGLSELAHRQRSAVALVQCGDHTVGDVADLFGLPVPAVAMLLSSGLRDLQATDRRAATGNEPTP